MWVAKSGKLPAMHVRDFWQRGRCHFGCWFHQAFAEQQHWHLCLLLQLLLVDAEAGVL